MSRDWKDYNYLNSDLAWSWIDEMSMKIELKMEEDVSKTGEFYKAFLAGQKEMLDGLCELLRRNEISLREIAQSHDLRVSEDEE